MPKKFRTNIPLTDKSVHQRDECVLTLCGNNYIDAVGTFQYSSCAHATYTCRSIPDVEYVNLVASGSTGTVTGATNGLTLFGANIGLGGTLTGDTTINQGAFDLNFIGSTASLCLSEATDAIFLESLCTYINFRPTVIQLSGGSNSLSIATGGTVYVSSDGTGICYAEDYSTGFTNCSLITKQFLESCISGFTFNSITGATNIGGGSGIYSGTSNQSLQLRTLVGSGGTVVSVVGNVIRICSTDPTGTTVAWGSITGDIWNQGDLYDCYLVPFTGFTGTTNTCLSELRSDIDTVSGITVTNDGRLNYLENLTGITNASITGATNLGTGEGTIYTSTSNRNLQLKTITGGTNVTITCDANYICISSNDASGIEWSGNTVNGVGTYIDANCICAQPNLTFDGTTLSTTALSATTITGGTICAITGFYGDGTNITNVDAVTLDGYDSTDFVLLSGYTAYTASTYTCLTDLQTDIDAVSGLTINLQSDFTGFTATTDNRLDYLEGLTGITTTAITGATNGLTKVGQDVVLGGTLTGDTNITGAYSLRLTGGTILDTQCGLSISGTPFLRATPNNTSNVRLGGGFVLNDTTTGTANLVFGDCALFQNTTGSDNIVLGREAMYENCTGGNNYAIGLRALYENKSGSANIAMGIQSQLCNQSGVDNIAIGSYTLLWNQTGRCNIALGYAAYQRNATTAVCDGIGIGQLAMRCVGGNCNIGIGKETLYNACLGTYNVGLGVCAGYNESGSSRLHIHSAAGATAYPLIYGEFNNRLLTIHGTLKVTGVTSGTTTDNLLVWNSTDCQIYSLPFSSGDTCATWGCITGNITGQTDLYNCLNARVLCSDFNTYTGNTATCLGNIDTCFTTKVDVSVYSGFTGTTDNRLDYLEGLTGITTTAITGATNGLTKVGQDVILGGALTGETSISGGYHLNITGNTKLNTQCGLQISGVTVFDVSRNNFSNLRIGRGALFSNTGGSCNIAFGDYALYCNTTGCNNIAIGDYALYCNTTGYFNIAIGDYALCCNCGTGIGVPVDNIAIGTCALLLNRCGKCNIAIGRGALINNISSCKNIAIGYQALTNNTTGFNSIGIGIFALRLQCGSVGYNIGIGHCTLNFNVIGSFNIAMGECSQWCATSASYNISLGVYSGYRNRTGSGNIAIGHCALYGGVDASGCNVAIGYLALGSGTPVSNNIGIGSRTLYTTTGSSNIAIGTCAGYSETGSNKLYIDGTGTGTQYPLIYGDFAQDCVVIHGALKVTGVTSGTCNDQNVVWNSSDCQFYTVPYISGDTTAWGCITGNITGQTDLINCLNARVLCSDFDTYTGDTATCLSNIDTCFTTKVDVSVYSGFTGTTDSRLDYLEGLTGITTTAITGATNGLTKVGQDVVLGGTLTGDTQIDGNFTLSLTGNTKLNTQCGLQISGVTMFDATRNSLTEIAIGRYALINDTGASYNVAIGDCALCANTTGNKNIAIGSQALRSNVSGVQNVAIGEFTLRSNNSGANNVAIGRWAASCNNTGSCNVALGSYSLYKNQSGCGNFALGLCTQCGLLSGNFNVGIGTCVLSNNVSGSNNIAFGYGSMFTGTGGTNNVAIGVSTLNNNTTGANNIALGYQALRDNITGICNIAFGYLALSNNETGCNNVAIGGSALLCNVVGNLNVAIGNNALYFNTSGLTNIAIGNGALQGNTTGCANIAMGCNALVCNQTGLFNVALGSYAQWGNRSGSDSIGLGFNALYCNTGGSCNIAFGRDALRLNISGSHNTAIGLCAGYNETGSSKLYIANSGTQYPLIYGDFAQDCVVIHGALKITGVTSGSASDPILTWDAATCEVKQIASISTNIYTIDVITGSTTVPSSGYTIFVNHIAPVTINLPVSPSNGAAYKIKDAAGVALTNNITISGNTKNIDGSPTVRINTDYGAIEVAYSSSLDEWFTLSFVN